MKALVINLATYCEFPEGMSSAEEFVKYLNEHYQSFVELKTWKDDECVEPYFIEGQQETMYVNVAWIRNVTEKEITILSKEEYDRRLEEVVKEKCQNCKSYIENCVDNLQGHRDMISLDGKCWNFQRRE